MDVQELYKRRVESFIETRKVIETNVNTYMERISQAISIEPDTFASVQYMQGKTCADILPALWQEPFDNAKFAEYQSQLETFKQFTSQVSTIADKINEEALRCLSA